MSQNQTTSQKSNSSKLSQAMPSKGKALAAAASVAAAAVGVAAVKKYRGRSGESEPKMFAVTPNGDGWQVLAGESDKPASTYETKKEALAAAREMAHGDTPSRLVVHRQDGTIQDSFSYDE